MGKPEGGVANLVPSLRSVLPGAGNWNPELVTTGGLARVRRGGIVESKEVYMNRASRLRRWLLALVLTFLAASCAAAQELTLTPSYSEGLGTVTDLSFVQNGGRLFLVIRTNRPDTISAFQTASGGQRVSFREGFVGVGLGESPSQEGVVAAASSAGVLTLWRWPSGEEQTFSSSIAKVWDVALTPYGEVRVVGSDSSGQLWFWSSRSPEPVVLADKSVGSARPLVSTSKPALVILPQGNQAFVWAPQGPLAFVFPVQAARLISSVTVSPDGGRVALGFQSGYASVYKTSTQEGLWDSTDIPTTVSAMTYSRDGNMLAVGDLNGSIRLFDAASGIVLSRATVSGEVDALAFSPDGRLLAAGGAGHVVTVFEISRPVAP